MGRVVSILSLLVLVATVFITGYHAIRIRRRGQVDVFLLVASLALIGVLSGTPKGAGLFLLFYNIRAILLLAQPYLIVRLAVHFCPLPRRLPRAALVGTLVGSALVILTIPSSVTARTLVIGAYFVAIQSIAAWAFTKQARRTAGVISWRLWFVAAASWLLVALVLLSSASAVFPNLRSLVGQWSSLLASGIIMSYFLGLATPRSVRRVWQRGAVYEFLRDNAARSPRERALAAADSLCHAAVRSTGATAGFVVLADVSRDQLRFAAACSASAGAYDNSRVTEMIDSGAATLPDAPRFSRSDGSLVIPIGSRRSRLWGAVLVVSELGAVFPQDDADIVGLMAQHTADALDQDAALTELAETERLHQDHQRIELEDTRQRLLDILEAATDFITISQPDGSPLYINQAARRALDIGADETVTTLFAFWPPEYEQLFRHEILPALERDGVWAGQTDYVGRAGQRIPTSQVSVAHRTAAGHVEFFSTISRDISDVRRTEEGLRRAEERTRFALEAARAGVWEADLSTGAVTWSGSMEMVHGITRSQFRGTLEHLLELIHPDDRAAVGRMMQTHVAEGSSFEFESRTMWPDGTVHWMESRGRVVLDESGLPARVLGVAQDVTKRKLLEESRERLANILEATPDFVTIGRLEGEPLYINPAARAALGIGPQERIPSLFAFRPAGFPALFSTTILPTAIRDGAWRGDAEYVSRSGRVIPVSQVLLVHKNLNGDVEYISTVSMDVTAHRQLETELRQAQKMEAVGQLAAGVAHDFNNILTVIFGDAELLADAPQMRESDRQAVAEIKDAAARGAGLTRQLLAFGRRQILQPKATKLSRVVTPLLPMLSRLLGDHILIDAHVDDGDPVVFADVTHVEQVIVNLAVNARDAMPNGGRLSIATTRLMVSDAYAAAHPGSTPGCHAELTIQDTGEGMSAETMARIFEPFFTTKPIGRGTGLGLATVYGIVQQMKGTIDVTSEVGVGTLFRVLIPQSETEMDANTEAPREDTRPSITTGTERILVVEDESVVRQLIVRVLTRQGYDVTGAADITEGAAALAIGRLPDLIVTDMQMPGGSGLDLIDAARRKYPGVRVILMSGCSDYNANASALHAFLGKPFLGSQLLSLVRTVLDAPP